MAILAVSVLGAGIGQAVGIGASAGWLIGSLVGNWLFAKGSKTEGPRLTDLTVQSSTEGAPITICYGTIRIAGNMVWSSGLLETKTKQKVGGKGMGGKSTSVTYTYRASFAIGLCEGPIYGIRKIWADGKLIYNTSSNASGATLYASREKIGTLAVYTGTSSQSADPTIQAYEGAADTPAFRNLAYLVFTDFQLADFGNRIPNITCEVVTAGSGTAPYQVVAFPSLMGQVHAAQFNNGVIETVAFSGGISGGNLLITRTHYKYNMSGVEIARSVLTNSYPENALGDMTGGSGFVWKPAMGNLHLSIMQVQSVGIEDEASEWFYDVNATGESTPRDGLDYYGQAVQSPVYSANYVYHWQQNQTAGVPVGVLKRAVIGSQLIGNAAAFYQITNGVHDSNVNDHLVCPFLSVAPDGTIWFVKGDAPSGDDIWHLDANLTEIETFSYPGAYSSLIDGSSGVAIYDDLMMDCYVPAPATARLRLWRLTAGTITYIGDVAASPASLASDIFHLGNGLVLHNSGIYSMLPPINPTAVTLKTIVDDICERCGITSSFRATTNLNSTTVDGYAIGRHISGRAAIEPLRQAYFFDGVESGSQLKFVMRGGVSAATLTEDDLGFGNDSSSLVKVTRQLEYELPVMVNVGYLDKDNDYQPGNQHFRRLITPSDNVVDIEFALALSSTKAAQIAEVLCINAWVEREQYEFQMTRKHTALEPTDIVTLPGSKLARIVATDYSDAGTIKAQALADIAAQYSPVAVGNDSTVNNPQEVPIGGPSNLIILDIMTLEAAYNQPGVFVAVNGYYSGWRGAEILISDDEGNTYRSLDAVTDAAIVGMSTTALAAPVGNAITVIDYFNKVTVTLVNANDTLSSITDAQFLAGGNLAALYSGTGWEIFQFRDATLVSGTTYTLSVLMRGLLGTENYIGSHNIGDQFVLIEANGITFLELVQADVGTTKPFKAVTFGDTYADVFPQYHTLVGGSQRPIAPVLFDGSPDPATANWNFTWRRRARIDYWWRDNFDIALEEDTEAYTLEIYDALSNLIATKLPTSESYTYTAADQITDFGGYQSTLRARVCQKSAQIGNGLFTPLTTFSPPNTGEFQDLVLSMLPALFVYTWTSTTVVNDISLLNLDGAFSGTKSVNQTPSPIADDSAARFVTFSAGGYGYIEHSSNHNTFGSFSVMCLAKFTATTQQFLFCKGSSGAGCWNLQTNGSGQITFRFTNSTGENKDVVSSSGYDDDVWHLFIGVFEMTGTSTARSRIYIDGTLNNTTTSHTGVVPNNSNVQRLGFGARGDGSGPLNGSISACAIFHSALTATDVANIYAALQRP